MKFWALPIIKVALPLTLIVWAILGIGPDSVSSLGESGAASDIEPLQMKAHNGRVISDTILAIPVLLSSVSKHVTPVPPSPTAAMGGTGEPTFTSTPVRWPMPQVPHHAYSKCIERGSQMSNRLPITSWVSHYDEMGLISDTLYDTDLDGEGDYLRTYSRNADGTLQRIENDDEADGSIESYCRFEHTARRMVRSECDSDGDGRADYVRVYSYNSAGNLLLETLVFYDTEGKPAEGSNSSRFFYSPSGDLVRVDQDSDYDGGIDHRDLYEWDGGLLWRRSEDLDVDGEVDVVWDYWYDQRSRIREMRYDFGADHLYEKLYSYRYNSQDALVRREEFVGKAVDFLRIHAYDEGGRLTRTISSDVGLGAETSVILSYECGD